MSITTITASDPQVSAALAIAPVPRCSLSIRAAATADIPFIDALQRMHTHMVGWMPGKQIEEKINSELVLVAEDERQTQLGYVIAKDQYMKRDDVGIIYQLNVMPLRQRHLVGASLVKACFERAAYGCRLFSCWCAQDIQANWFWESIGFIPLAFRTGSRAKQRIHIFWQRRVRDNDQTTPHWFPSQTSAGAVGENRIVLPIPQGTHWRDAKPLVLPGIAVEPELPKTLPGGQPVRLRPDTGPKLTRAQRAVIMRSQSKHLGGVPLGKKAVLRGGRIKYIDRPDYVPELDGPDELMEPVKPKRAPRPRHKNDPKYIAAARELRDRFLEQVNSERMLPAAHGKYDVSRQLPAQSESTQPLQLLSS